MAGAVIQKNLPINKSKKTMLKEILLHRSCL